MTKTDRYDSLFQYYWEQATQKYSLTDVTWLFPKAVTREESSFDPRATSNAGARGLMQVMQKTWTGDRYLPDVYNPEEVIRFGTDYLGYLWSQFKEEQGLERWKFALGSYNAGLGSILRCQLILKSKNVRTDLWSPIADVLPAVTGSSNAHQTTDYVTRIIAFYKEYTDASGS